jgi:hypothetical protein
MLKGLGRLFSIVVTVWALSGLLGIAEELPLTENVPMSEFQNRTEDVKAYDFDAPPQGLFRSITMAEDFEERLGSLRTHEIVPIKPTERFRADVAAIFIVFSLHQHYQAFTVSDRGRSSAKTPCTSLWRMKAGISPYHPPEGAGSQADIKLKFTRASKSTR